MSWVLSMRAGSVSKTLILCVVFLCIFAGGVRCHAEPSASDRTSKARKAPPFYLERAKIQLERKHYAAALRSLSMVIRATPELAEAYTLRGRAYDKIGASYKAIQDYTKYIELKPRDERGYVLRGDARNFSGSHEEALEDYNTAISLSPRSVSAYLGRGLAYAGLERYGRAMKDYQWVLALDPDNNEAAENMALACMHSGKHIQAVGYFERALRNEPNPAWRGRIQRWLDQIINDPYLEARKTDRSSRPRPMGPTAKPLW